VDYSGIEMVSLNSLITRIYREFWRKTRPIADFGASRLSSRSWLSANSEANYPHSLFPVFAGEIHLISVNPQRFGEAEHKMFLCPQSKSEPSAEPCMTPPYGDDRYKIDPNASFHSRSRERRRGYSTHGVCRDVALRGYNNGHKADEIPKIRSFNLKLANRHHQDTISV
jgi:hypothetical protein